MIYNLLAPIYDRVNADVDYQRWADFIEDIFHRNITPTPELVLDLGCGTGRMTIELAKRGYDMTGVDISAEMLDIAREEAERKGVGNRILWLSQDMRAFELYGTVEAVVSCLDSINHLTTSSDLKACFSLVHNYLSPDGLFVFDINGRHKFESVYADNTYAIEVDDAVCVWQNYYSPRTKLCDFYITLFKEDEDGRYSRYDECDRERMYTLRAVKKQLADTGFELIGAYSDFDFTDATDEDDRIYIVARCKK